MREEREGEEEGEGGGGGGGGGQLATNAVRKQPRCKGKLQPGGGGGERGGDWSGTRERRPRMAAESGRGCARCAHTSHPNSKPHTLLAPRPRHRTTPAPLPIPYARARPGRRAVARRGGGDARVFCVHLLAPHPLLAQQLGAAVGGGGEAGRSRGRGGMEEGWRAGVCTRYVHG